MAIGLNIINGDFIINTNGAVDTVSESKKCLRDFGKMLRTDVETPENKTKYFRYNPTYGNLLAFKELYSNMSKRNTLEALNELIYTTIQNYLTLQESRNNLDLGEVILDITFDTYYDTLNPNLVIIPVKIINGQGLELSAGIFEQRVA